MHNVLRNIPCKLNQWYMKAFSHPCVTVTCRINKLIAAYRTQRSLLGGTSCGSTGPDVPPRMSCGPSLVLQPLYGKYSISNTTYRLETQYCFVLQSYKTTMTSLSFQKNQFIFLFHYWKFILLQQVQSTLHVVSCSGSLFSNFTLQHHNVKTSCFK